MCLWTVLTNHSVFTFSITLVTIERCCNPVFLTLQGCQSVQLLTVEAAPYLWFLFLAYPFLFLLYLYIYTQHSDCGCSMDLCSDAVFSVLCDVLIFHLTSLRTGWCKWFQGLFPGCYWCNMNPAFYTSGLKCISVLSIRLLVSTEFQQYLISIKSISDYLQEFCIISACWHFKLLLPFQLMMSVLIKTDPSLNLWGSLY